MAALEIRLAPGEAPVDLSVRILEPRQAREIAPLLPPASSHVAEFLSGWAAGRWRPEPVHSVWLEFDLDREPGAGLPAPVVCARLERGTGGAAACELLSRLRGAPISPRQARWLRDAADPAAGCRLLYVFSLESRPGRPIRCEFYGEELASLESRLARLGSGLSPSLTRLRPIFEKLARDSS